MNFFEFKNKFLALGCFNVNQIYAWNHTFNRNNLTNWHHKGYLVFLRNGFYAFPEFIQDNHYQYFIANKIYKPSYISLQSALAYYEIIPETVVQTTSITTIKTKSFENDIGQFYYKNIKSENYFGFQSMPISKNKNILMAEPEKAILDFLYLNPFYTTKEDFLNLRFNEDILKNELNKELLLHYGNRVGKKTLSQRIEKMLKAYQV